ncbi:MAG: hypothetical protein JWP16_1155 [Alphaproteobacteria bacterium]|nr:hypothetical protein [Alphaproteobacteria bacterium]MDB5740115.1 hypothetical protein [Alphaproteobacteria bacterium]
MRPTSASWLLAALMLAVLCAPAQAALTLCNRTSYILYAATSAIQSPRSDAQGWTRIAPGDCQLARKEPLTAETYLVHARSSLAHSGPARAWGGSYPVCVKDGNFSSRQGVTQPYCTAEDTFALPFAPLDNRGRSVWTMNFDEQPALGSLSAAQLAGVKRLLADNGYKVGGINGQPDRATGAALTDFRNRMHFAPNAGNVELFEALEREARKNNAPAGYTVCNESGDTLLVALAQEAGGKSVSRGWWTVPRGACAKTITTPLADDAVWLLAQKKSGGTLVGGPQRFCTAAAAFEIAGAGNCSARHFTEAGFARTDTRDKQGFVAHIGAAGLKH